MGASKIPSCDASKKFSTLFFYVPIRAKNEQKVKRVQLREKDLTQK